MELDRNQTNQTYIRLLIDSSNRKQGILKELMLITEQQEMLLKQEDFEEDLFSLTIEQKEALLIRLNELDSGFEQIYSNVKEELKDNRFRYEIEIKTIQEQITAITDTSVRLQALEQRNKLRLEAVLAAKRKDIRSSKVSSQTAAKYYKTMTNQNEVQALFYDKKN